MGGITRGPTVTNGYELKPGEYETMLRAQRLGDLDCDAARITEHFAAIDNYYRALAKRAIEDPAFERFLPGYAGPSDCSDCHQYAEAVDV